MEKTWIASEDLLPFPDKPLIVTSYRETTDRRLRHVNVGSVFLAHQQKPEYFYNFYMNMHDCDECGRVYHVLLPTNLQRQICMGCFHIPDFHKELIISDSLTRTETQYLCCTVFRGRAQEMKLRWTAEIGTWITKEYIQKENITEYIIKEKRQEYINEI